MSEPVEQLAVPPSAAAATEPMRVAAVCPNGNAAQEPPPEEIDVWWGAYSGWTMLPSMAICLVLTGLLAFALWAWGPRGYRQLLFLGLGAALWLVQGVRFAWRVFGCNYRLTSRRLFRDCGFLRPEMVGAHLDEIAAVSVKRSTVEKLVRVGRVIVSFEDRARPPLVLEGVRHPYAVADMIREWRQIARDMKNRLIPG